MYLSNSLHFNVRLKLSFMGHLWTQGLRPDYSAMSQSEPPGGTIKFGKIIHGYTNLRKQWPVLCSDHKVWKNNIWNYTAFLVMDPSLQQVQYSVGATVKAIQFYSDTGNKKSAGNSPSQAIQMSTFRRGCVDSLPHANSSYQSILICGDWIRCLNQRGKY